MDDPEISSFMISIDFEPQFDETTNDNFVMKDESKLVLAFLALNAGVIALAFAGYTRGGMNIGAVFQHLNP